MNITKIEIIKAMLDDSKVLCVEVKYREGLNEAVFTLKVFSSKSLIFKSLRHPMTAIQALTPIYHPTPDICVGDLVWYVNKTRTVVHIDENRKEAALNYSKEESNIICQTSDLILLKKAEPND